MSESPLDLHRTFRAVIEATREAGVSHAFIGALPVLAWARVRATTDLDVVVLAGNDWSRLTSALRARGLEQARSVGPADVAESLFDARAAAGDALDWAFLEKWAAVWGISERLSSYRARFGPRR